MANKKYKVTIWRDKITLEIEAENEQEARELAWFEYDNLDQAEVEDHIEIKKV